jgi:hypothetical protein
VRVLADIVAAFSSYLKHSVCNDALIKLSAFRRDFKDMIVYSPPSAPQAPAAATAVQATPLRLSPWADVRRVCAGFTPLPPLLPPDLAAPDSDEFKELFDVLTHEALGPDF